jgi:hypothetical protein
LLGGRSAGISLEISRFLSGRDGGGVSDGRAIGVFDSGVGGLTVLRALRTALPE